MFDNVKFLQNEDLSRFSTIGIGGVAKYVAFPKNVAELKIVFETMRKNNLLRYAIVGNCSNILFDVEFFDGVLISTKEMKNIQRLEENRVYVEAGTNMFVLNQKLQEWGLGGLEWSCGIPASFGGLVYMNGGAFGSEIKDRLEELTIFEDGEIFRLKTEEIDFSYRNSNLGQKLVLGGILALFERKSRDIQESMRSFLTQRKEKQAFGELSLGSVFKREMGKVIVYPAKLIDSLGLKGAKIGGVEVSTKHAGFIVNKGNAKAKDFVKLVEIITQKVYENYGIILKREVIYLSEKESFLR